MSDVTSRPWFRWATGMRTACGLRVYAISAGGIPLGVRENDRRARPEVCALPHDAQPAPDDPATLGCLTQRAREMWGDPTISTVCRRRLRIPDDPASGWDVGPWSAVSTSYSVTIEIATGPTEFAALLAACDAAPVNTTTTKDSP